MAPDDFHEKPLRWLVSTRDDLKSLPRPVMRDMGHALSIAQMGGAAASVKALKGFGGRGVLEVRADHVGDTYRAVYTVRFAAAIYVLHVFQKKSKRGVATPKHDVDLIRTRLRMAADDYREWLARGAKS